MWQSCAYLDLAVDPSGGGDQMSIIEPTQEELTGGHILRESGATVASRMMAKRRLNVLGEVNSQCVWANNPERVKKLKQAAGLARQLPHGQRAQERRRLPAGAPTPLRAHAPGHTAGARLEDVRADRTAEAARLWRAAGRRSRPSRGHGRCSAQGDCQGGRLR